MAECFCGCGRRVGFGNRGINKNGQRTRDLLAKLRDTRDMIEERGPLDPSGDNGPILEGFAAKISEGEAFEEAWEDVVHSGVDGVPPSHALAFRREWNSWAKDSIKFDSLTRELAAMSPEELAQFREGIQD